MSHRPKAIIDKIGEEYRTRITKVPTIEKGQILPRSVKNSDKKQVVGDKLRNNVMRAKKVVYELVMCNDWTWFGTATIDAKKWSRYDLQTIKKKFIDFIRNTGATLNVKINYVIVPEPHANGAWHFHFVLYGLPGAELERVANMRGLSSSMKMSIREGEIFYSWPACAERFGSCCMQLIGHKLADKKRVANYLKASIDGRVAQYGAHLYFASQKLKRAERVAEGYACRDMVGDDVFENARIKQREFSLDQLEEALSYVSDEDLQLNSDASSVF